MNPAQLFPNMSPMSTPMPAMWEARQMLNFTDEAYNQLAQQNRMQALQEQQQQLALQESRLNQPVAARQRELQMGTMGGQIERLPSDNAAALAESQFKANPQFQQGRFAAMLRENADKIRTSDLKKYSEELDLAVSAFHPMMEDLQTGNLTNAQASFAEGLRTLKDAKVDVSRLESMPPDRAMPLAMQMYKQAMNTAPTLRKIYTDRQHSEALANIHRLDNESRERIAKVRADAIADKPPTTIQGLVARILEKYTSNRAEVTKEEAATVVDYMENNLGKMDEELNSNTWQAAEKIVRDEEKKTGVSKANRGIKVRELYFQLVRRKIAEKYGPLYERAGISVTTNPAQPGSSGTPSAPTIDFSQLPPR